MTRVLHVLDHSLPLHSGYTFRTRAILKAQQALGLEVRGVTGLRHTQIGPQVEEADGLTFHRTGGGAGGPAGLREMREIGALADAIVAMAQDWMPDVLHAHSPALCGMAAIRAGKRLGIPVVYEIRAFWEDAAVGNGTGAEGSVKYRLTRALENRVVDGADAVMTICHGLREDLISRGCDEGRIGIMPNGVDMEMFGRTPPRDDALAQELGIGAGPVIGFIGSFYDYEGLDDLIAAMPALVAQHPQARLLLTGGGPVEKQLRRAAADSPVSGSIIFTGRVPHDRVDSYYGLCDVMVYPRKKSRLTDLVTPLKPLEAMAQGRLVAASDVGGHRELIEHGRTGTLFAPDDPDDCATALSTLLCRRGDWDSLRQAARDHVREKHDWRRNAARYLDVYQVLLAQGTTGRISAAA